MIHNVSRAVVFLAALLAGVALPPRAEARDRPPNILIMVADDLGWRDVGYHDSDIKTPNLDKLARDGVRLERHYVCPTCSPTRAGLLTGRNPSRFGIHGPIDGRSKQALPSDAPTLARTLKTRGYVTALFGKWHLGLRPEVGPRRYGFDQSYGYLHGQIDQYTHRYKNGDRTWHRNDALIDEKGHATDLIAEESIRFLATKRKEPFFLHVAFSVPHHPVQEEDKWIEPYKATIKDSSRRLYAASVAHLDAAVGRLVEALDSSGKLADTLIFFTSDNGGQRDYRSATDYEGKHGPYPTLGDNRPLRGWKGELYEGGIRVPAFAYWKGEYRSARIESVTSYLDVCPTLLVIAGEKPNASWRLEGRDLGPLWSGAAAPAPPTLYWNTGRQAGILHDPWKLIVAQRGPETAELYNLADDPMERKNQSDQVPEKVEALRKLLAQERLRDR